MTQKEKVPHQKREKPHRWVGAAVFSLLVHLVLVWCLAPFLLVAPVTTQPTQKPSIRIRILKPRPSRTKPRRFRLLRRKRQRRRKNRVKRRVRRSRRLTKRRQNQRVTPKQARVFRPKARPNKRSKRSTRRTRKGYRHVRLRPTMQTFQRIREDKGQDKVRERYPKDKHGYRHIARLWPGYHREYKGRQKAMNGLHHPFFEEVAIRMRRCWLALKPQFVKQYNRRYNMLQRQAKGMSSYRGHMRMVWNVGWRTPQIFWALPRPSSPVRNTPIVQTTKTCLKDLVIPASLKRRKRVLEAKWSFHIKIGVERPKLMAPVEIRKDPDRKPDSNPNYARAFVDLGSLANMWITKANFSIMTTAVY